MFSLSAEKSFTLRLPPCNRSLWKGGEEGGVTNERVMKRGTEEERKFWAEDSNTSYNGKERESDVDEVNKSDPLTSSEV